MSLIEESFDKATRCERIGICWVEGSRLAELRWVDVHGIRRITTIGSTRHGKILVLPSTIVPLLLEP
jgi:hypothetical protein